VKQFISILTFLVALSLNAQEAIHNFGSLKIHSDAMVGFHANLINDGAFDENEGLAGFYREEEQLTISGSSNPIFYDAEIITPMGLILETSMGIINNGNLITGDIFTPKNQSSVSSDFLNNSFYTGESGVSKVNGYAGLTNKESFTFPVGDNKRIRTLRIESMAINATAKCAYFFEDPNAPKSLSSSFSTQKRASNFISVSDKEFWVLEGDVPSRVTLSWDALSDVQALGEYLSDLKVVGWHKLDQQWVNLGNIDIQGGRDYGTVTSDIFVPSDYEIITIGGNDDAMETFESIELDNYYLTPNGDGQNDILRIGGIERSPNNNIQIFNRYGVLVYSKDNYQNDFDGHSNRKEAIKRSSGLESGIYFYIITLNDLRQKHQGYLYISN